MLVPELPTKRRLTQNELIFSSSESEAAVTKEGLVRRSIRELFPVLMSELGEPRTLQLMASIANIIRYCPESWKQPCSSTEGSLIVWRAALLRLCWELVRTPIDPDCFRQKALRDIFRSPASKEIRWAEALILGWMPS